MKKITLFVIALVAFVFCSQAQKNYVKHNPTKRNIGYRMAIEPQFADVAVDFSEGIAGVFMKYGQGVTNIDTSGNSISPETYPNVRPFSNGLAAVEKDQKWGYINKEGKVVIPFEYVLANDFSDGLGLVNIDVFGDDQYYRRAYIDSKGRALGAQIKGVANNFSEGYAAIQGKDNTWTIINKKYVATSSRLLFDEIGEFHEGLARVKQGNNYGFIDTLGKVVIPIQPLAFGLRFYEGYCLVMIDGKYGYMDKFGKIVLPCKYTYAENFSCGRAVVSESTKRSEGSGAIDGGFGVIDHDGNYVVKPDKFEFIVGPFSDGFAIVGSDEGKVGYIDINGKVMIPMIYEQARPFHNGFGAVKVDGKWGFLQITDEVYREAYGY